MNLNGTSKPSQLNVGNTGPPMGSAPQGPVGPWVAPPQDQPIVIMVHKPGPDAEGNRREKIYPQNVILRLSSIQLLFCLMAITSNIIGMAFPYAGIAYSGVGIWCGITFGISGSVGLWAGHHSSHCSIISSMVLAIISASFCVPLLIICIAQ